MTTKKCLFMMLCLCASLASSAQTPKDTILLGGFKVFDGYYEKPLPQAHVSIYEKDSTTLLVDSMHPSFNGGWSNGKEMAKVFNGFFALIPRRTQVVIRIACPGYPVDNMLLNIPKRQYGRLVQKYIVEKPHYLWQMKEVKLGEASVTASRILMVMKGDTIEYNAAAFQLAEGSMLDNLVRALPGVKLDNEGRITVNGEFVKNLLVNGRDFFNGDPKVALSNLPAFTVNKVQVYRKGSAANSMRTDRTGEEKEKDPLVMDVKLKREYANGWLSNYEVGAGSNLKDFDEKWLARLFAMRYTNHSMLAVYAGTNNLNDALAPGSKGEWQKVEPSAGEKKTWMAGINFSLDPKDSQIKYKTSLQAQRQETKGITQTNRETYYTTGNTYDRITSLDNNTTSDLKWNGNIDGGNPGIGWWTLNANSYYSYNKQHSLTHTASLRSDNATSAIDTLYDRTLQSRGRETRWGWSASLSDMYIQKWGYFEAGADITYNRTKSHTGTTDQVIYSHQSASNLTERRIYDMPQFDYTYKLKVPYEGGTYKVKTVSIKPFLKYFYTQQFQSGHQDLKRDSADWLTPSTASSAQWFRDEANTFHTTRLQREQLITPALWVWWKDINFRFDAPMSITNRRIDDYRAQQEKAKTTHDFLFSPTFEASWSKNPNAWGAVDNYGFTLEASIENELPDIMYLLDVRDDSDPMVRYLGNARLMPTRTYSIGGSYKLTTKALMRNLRVRLGYNRRHNSVSMASLYDSKTGVTTWQPFNINGNWQANMSIYYSQALDKKTRWNLSNELTFIRAHSVDYSSGNAGTSLDEMAVNNANLKDELRVDYRFKTFSLGMKANVDWTHLKSEDNTFSTFSYADFNCGPTCQWSILNCQLSTDLMVYMRRGYNDASMNTTDWVLNAQVSRAFGARKQWIVKATGFDLLQQISTIRRTVNAQGRTETWFNTIPSYAMLSLVYRLDIQPKKKSKSN